MNDRVGRMHIAIDGLPDGVPADEGDTILQSLIAGGVAVPYSCQAGNCGTCKCELIEGDVFELEYSEHALSAEERAKNVILACRAQVWGNVRIRRFEAEDLVLHPSRVMRCRVLALERLTHDITGLRLGVEHGGPFTFSAGQYARITVAPGLARPYSMANTPTEDELMFHIRHVPNGKTSGYVATELRVGNLVTVEGPLGIAYLRDRHSGPVLLVAGGSGLAPIESIARTLLERGSTQPITLYLGVRAVRDIYHEELLIELAAKHPSFQFHIVLSEESGTPHRTGFLHEAIAQDLKTTEGVLAYIAGPPPMVDMVTELLKARGVAGRDIRADAFYSQA